MNKMIPLILILFLLILLLIILFMPLKLKITIHKKVDIDLFLFGILSFRIDIDEIIKSMIRDKDNNINLRYMINNITNIFKLKKIYSSIAKKTIVDEINFEMYNDLSNPEIIVYGYYLYGLLNNFIKENFKIVKKVNYIIKLDNNDYKLFLSFRTYIYILLYISLLNIKNIFKVLKRKKEVKKN